MKKTLVSLIALALGFLLITPAAAAATVLSGQPDAVEYLASLRLLPTLSDGEFHPEVMVTRLDFTVAVVEALYPEDVKADSCFSALASSLPVSYTKLFADVRLDDPYAKHVCIAMLAGLVDGNRDGRFRPDDQITVAEASKILARSYGLVYPSLQPSGHAWYWSSMEAMRELQAISENTGPALRLSRGGMATMFFALRTQERFPLHRIVGQMPVASLPLTVEATTPLEGASETASAVIIISPFEPAKEQPMEPDMQEPGTEDDIIAEATPSVETVVRTRRGEKISRRMLLQKIAAERSAD